MIRGQVTKLHVTCHQTLMECVESRPELVSNMGNPNYQQTLVSEQMKRIPPTPFEIPSKVNKLVDRVAWHNPKVYDGKYDQVKLEEQIREIKKIFIVVEVSEEKKVIIWMFYPTGEVNIWWNTIKDKLLGPNFT